MAPRRRDQPPTSYRAHLALCLTLGALALLLGLSRFVTGPWFHVYHPPETSLLEGRPVSWEAVYYTDHLPTFTAGAPPRLGIAPVHYRTLLALYLAATFYTYLERQRLLVVRRR